MKKKIPIAVSIDEDLASWISKKAEDPKFRNKSHVVEEAINEFLEKHGSKSLKKGEGDEQE